MKISKFIFPVLFIAILIFIIPFFWLKPGEMDLGGDNSRLYFYDPIAYLISQSLYSVSHSGLGAENLSFYPIPFFLLLAVVKSLIHSSTLLIVGFYGISLSIGFVSCYLVVKELLNGEKEISGSRTVVVEVSGMLAGLFYTLSPIPIHWWTYPILSQNQAFLNPLLFFVLLRFFLTSEMRYLLFGLLVSFIFSPNFSYVGAPTFFAFFPIALLFLLIYTKYVRKRTIPFKKLAVGLILFILIQAFHLIPQITSILIPGSVAHETVFGSQGKFEWGLKYFIATAPIIKVSNSWLGLPQFGIPEFYSPIFILFPLMFVLGFLWNRSRLYLLSAIFCLIAFFFVTANITTIGFKLYAFAFRLPGFSMFRVFYGQWQWSYLFFYTLFVGLAIAIVSGKLKSIQRYLLMSTFAVLLVVTSWSFITGKLTDTTHWQSKGIKSHVVMDPAYEEMLAFIRSLPIDGKIISFPLNDHGYQVLKGANDAAYEGPSTITYLAARNEFNGLAEFGIFGDSLLIAAREKNYAKFKNFLTLLNIKYIFYNEDPFIYTDNYPGLPYTRVRNFFPDTQEGYKDFIKNLGVKEIKTIAGKYHIYEIDDATYVPHIYAAKYVTFWNDSIATNIHAPLSFYTNDKRVALYDDINIYTKLADIFDDVFLKARNTSIIFDFFKKKEQDKFVSPTISQTLSSLIYPLVVLREERDLASYKTVNDVYIDRSIYFAEKRINELFELKEIPLLRNIESITGLGNIWTEPKLWEFQRHKEYNSWEITLVRYQRAIEELIGKIETTNQSDYSKTISKVELKSYLTEHKNKLRTAIRQDSSLSVEDRSYLSSLTERMFTDIYVTLNLVLPDFNNIPYSLENPVDNGAYEVYVNREDVQNLDIDLSADGQKLLQQPSDQTAWMKFENVVVANKSSLPFVLSIHTLPNLVANTQWNTAEQATEQDSITLAVTYDLSDTSGLVRDIAQWQGDTIYAISFDYLTYDQNFSMGIHEKGGSVTNKYSKDLYEETFKSKEWKKFSAAVLSSKDADSAVLHITKAQDDHENADAKHVKKISIKNVTVQKVYDPKIVFKKVTEKKEMSIPTITFTQINPAKYKISVQDAKDPYALVLSQSFNQKWKLFFPDSRNKAKTVREILARFVGTIFKMLTRTIIKSPVTQNTEIVARYDNGSINEGIHTSVFWNNDTFETWGQDPIAEEAHFQVNDYANAWYIRPEDVGNQKDYTLIIEMTSQKSFYGSLFLSAGALLLVIFMLLQSLIKNRK